MKERDANAENGESSEQPRKLRMVYPVGEIMHPNADEINAIVKEKIAKHRKETGEFMTMYTTLELAEYFLFTDSLVEETCKELGYDLPFDWDENVGFPYGWDDWGHEHQ